MKKNHFAPLAHKHIIYQLLVRVFSNAVSKNKAYGTLRENGCGKFIDIDESVLSAIQELGVTHIWYTGILEHSSLSAYPEAGIPADDPFIVKGRAGSPYAVRDYYDVDPDLAVQVNQRLEEFEAMLNRTHAAGLKAIIDFVPNHVARSYASDKNPGRQPDFGAEDDPSVMFRPDNNFLYLAGEGFTPPADYQPLGGAKLRAGRSRFQEHPARVTGNDVYSSQPSSNDWFETIKLNFGVDPHPPHHCYFDPLPRTWLQLLDILIYWCEKGVDGFRCDMAEMVPAEFWEWIIPCVKTRFPDCIFIGEIYKPGLYRHYLEKGYFDYLYDKVSLYDTLCGIIRGQTPADELSRCIKSVEDFSEKMLSFLENHDELRLASSQFTGEIMTAWPAMVVCATCSKGPVMLYFGQEVGETADVNVGFAGERGRTSIFDYCAAPEHQKWYNRGRCDGGKLSEPQRYLRRAYASLLRLAACSEAINKGGFY
ncbi:MAG: alpha-amylase family protein, partial [Bacteroidia bacterium]|nr:alpha-amylase family protein [Bacteroidia bacterium]